MQLMTQWERKGLTQGLRKGRAEGRLQEGQTLILRLLQRRFGPMPNGLEGQIRKLSLQQMETLAETVLDFSSVTHPKWWLKQIQ